MFVKAFKPLRGTVIQRFDRAVNRVAFKKLSGNNFIVRQRYKQKKADLHQWQMKQCYTRRTAPARKGYRLVHSPFRVSNEIMQVDGCQLQNRKGLD